MNQDLLRTMLAILLPIVFGWLLKKARVLHENEVAALRKFVVRVALPFLIFQNIYRADVESLRQALPVIAGFVVLTALYTAAALLIAPLLKADDGQKLTFAFSVFAGNYAFLGWGVIATFFGPAALTRAVFFSMFFWPVFLVCGFLLRRRFHLAAEHDSQGSEGFFQVLLRHAGVPIGTAVVALALNIGGVQLPAALNDFVSQFAALAIPLILFAIGQNLVLLMPAAQLRLVLAASFFRLLGGFVLGLATMTVICLLFAVDDMSRRVILLQAVMPTATMATFFGEYVPLDEKLLSGIIAVSTLLSFVTLPLWVLVINAIVG